MKIVIAGASGFIGSELMKAIPGAIGLSRGNPKSNQWIRVDLFSRSGTEKALEGCDVAVYLVHSMLPSNHLDQGNFEDFDLLISDNFARSCRINKVKQIIYVGGIIPNDPNLSPHLKSRQEVENILKSSGIPVTTLRAGLIIGARGSSFNILKNLANRMFFMITPKWLSNKMEPVSIEQIVESVKYCIDNKDTYNKTFDITMDEQVSYKELLKLTRSVQNKKTFQVDGFVPMWLIRLFMPLISRAPKNLILPLIESLQHHLISNKREKLVLPGFQTLSLTELLKRELKKNKESYAFKHRPDNHQVRSIQRIPVSLNEQVQIHNIYFSWLVHFFFPFFKVKTNGEICLFKFFGFRLLILQNLKNHSESNRELMAITGGMLTSKNQKLRYGRIEFRKFDNCIIVAIHDYVPSLPWPIYVNTQAKVHAFVMKRFSAYLINSKKRIKRNRDTLNVVPRNEKINSQGNDTSLPPSV